MKNRNFLLAIIAVILAGIFIILVLVPRPEPEIVFVPTTPLPETQETQEETSPSTPAPIPTPTPLPIPTPVPVPTKYITLGIATVAHPGEIFTVKDSYGDTFELTGFYYHPCPEGAMCIWSGLDIFYKVTLQQGKVYIKDKPNQSVSGFPYSVQVVDSDYQTYAKIILEMSGQNI